MEYDHVSTAQKVEHVRNRIIAAEHEHYQITLNELVNRTKPEVLKQLGEQRQHVEDAIAALKGELGRLTNG